MPGFFSNLFGGLFGGSGKPPGPAPTRKPTPPPSGSRSSKGFSQGPSPALTQAAAKERRERAQLEGNPLWRFLNMEEWVQCPQSSNVKEFRYLPQAQTLEVGFKDGSVYAYYGVAEKKAQGIFQAGSKGGWVWDHLRIRGTKLGHQHEYVMELSPTTRARLWERTKKAARKHGQRANLESGVHPIFGVIGQSRKLPKGAAASMTPRPKKAKVKK